MCCKNQAGDRFHRPRVGIQESRAGVQETIVVVQETIGEILTR
jgi:hypothetical protein